MPYISEETINKVRERLNIVGVVKDYVSLKKQGRNLVGLCPFHTEKTPSFNVSEEKGLYHCFGCNAGGNMIKFIMEIENVSFPESIEILAKKAGITVEYKKSVSKEVSQELELIYTINEKTAFIFHFYLKDRPEGEKARKYLKERNIQPEMIELFKLGFAPDDYSKLHKELLNEHFKETTILKAGLMLPRSKENMQESILDWRVASLNDEIIGCVSLVFFNKTLCEIRSLAVAEGYRKNGLAKKLIASALSLAIERDTKDVIALTRAPQVFEQLNFKKDDIRNFPEKVQQDCEPCPFINGCDEVALLYKL